MRVETEINEKLRKRDFSLYYMREKRELWKENPNVCNCCGIELTDQEKIKRLSNCKNCRVSGTIRSIKSKNRRKAI